MMNHWSRPRFIFNSPSEVLDCLDDIRYLDAIEPDREQWIPFRETVNKALAKVKFPAHLKDVSAEIFVDWQDWLQENWQKQQDAKSGRREHLDLECVGESIPKGAKA